MPTMTADERQARREADREFAARAVEALKSSEGWQAWLAARARFHHYSLANQLLIAMQKPDATRVAGFKAWLALGYCVRKGEKALRIWAPCPPSGKAIRAWEAAGAKPDDRPRTYFKLAAVFDASQVDPLPPPAQPAPLVPPHVETEGDELAHLLERPDGGIRKAALRCDFDFTIESRPPGRRENGYCIPDARKIVVYDDRPANAIVATAVHELAHARRAAAHADVKLTYAQEELVVESVTYTVLGALGIDISGYAIPYLASWSQREDLTDTIEQTASLIDAIARDLEADLIPEPQKGGRE